MNSNHVWTQKPQSSSSLNVWKPEIHNYHVKLSDLSLKFLSSHQCPNTYVSLWTSHAASQWIKLCLSLFMKEAVQCILVAQFAELFL